MFKSLILCVVLLFSFNSLALTNEEKARKLYVEVNLDLEKNCSDYFSIIDITKSLTFFSKVRNSYNLSDISDLIEYEERINEIYSCYSFIKNNFLPVIDEIQTEYSTTQVAYDLVKDSQIGLIKLSIDEVIESLLVEKKIIEVRIEKNKAEIEKENNRIINCFKSTGAKYQRKKIEGCEEGDTNYNPTKLTNSEINILISQLQDCLSITAGADITKDMYVKVYAEFKEDATVVEKSVKLIDTNISKSNIYYEAITNSAIRTFYNPDCSPLKLPLDKYHSWKNITITFDFNNLNM